MSSKQELKNLKRRWKREEFVILAMVIVFILGFYFIEGNVTGLVEFDRDFGTEAVVMGGRGKAILPHNMTGHPNVSNMWHDIRYINFTYNTTTDETSIGNCTLWMDIDDAGYEANETLNRTLITVEVNQTFNESFEGGIHKVIWKVGCYDDTGDMANTSARKLNLNYLVTQSKPNIGASAYYDPNYVVGMWSFEYGNSTWTPDTTGKNNGTVVGAKWVPDDIPTKGYPLQNISGRIGKGVYFDGDNDYINISASQSLSLSNEATLCFYVHLNSDTAGYLIEEYNLSFGGSSIDFYYGNFPAIYKGFIFKTDNGTVGTVVTTDGVDHLNRWRYVCGVISQSQNFMKLYVDGQEDTNQFFGNDITPHFNFPTGADASWIIGNKAALNGDFNGTIDEVVIWNRSLSANEIKQLYYSSTDKYNSTYIVQDIAAAPNNTADADNDTIKYIYNWYKNNESIAVLNMPFEAVNNGSEMNFTKDYSGYENHGDTSFNSNVLECWGPAGFVSCSGWNRTGGVDGRGAYCFDGKDDYIKKSVADWNNVETGTISAWVKMATTTGDIFSSSDEATDNYYFHVLMTSGYLSIVAVEDGSQIAYFFLTATPLSANTWYHIAIVSDGTEYQSFVDGQEQAVTLLAGSNGVWLADVSNRDSFAIGALVRTGISYEFNGTIDEVLLFDRALSAEQILALYRNQSHIIKAAETNPDETWHAQVVANDGYGDSTPQNTTALHLQTITLNVDNVAPDNSTSAQVGNEISFTYNYTNYENISGVDNCSLYLYETQWKRNNIKYWPIEDISNSFNITLEQGTYKWKVGCYDIESEQTNSSAYSLIIVTPPEGGSSPSFRSVKSMLVTPGLTKLIEFYNPDIPVISIEVQLNKEFPLQLEISKILESFVNQKLDSAYAYFEVKANLDNSYFDYTKLNFKVKKNFYDVVLYQLFDQGPYKISITKIYQDEKYNYYQAYVNSLGYFGITAKPSEKTSALLSGRMIKTLGKIKINVSMVAGLSVLFLIILILVYVIPHWRRL